MSEFGRAHAFKDVDSIPAGIDFREHIAATLKMCDVVLVVIGPRWLKARGGHRRLDDAKDFVRLEIESALARKIPVVPVLVGAAKRPRPELLPTAMAGLAYRQMAIVRGDPDFNHDVERLIATLKDGQAVSGTPRG